MNLIMLLGAILFWIYEIEDIIKIYEKRKSRKRELKKEKSNIVGIKNKRQTIESKYLLKEIEKRRGV